mgnify:CR=1 FL=1
MQVLEQFRVVPYTSGHISHKIYKLHIDTLLSSMFYTRDIWREPNADGTLAICRAVTIANFFSLINFKVDFCWLWFVAVSLRAWVFF